MTLRLAGPVPQSAEGPPHESLSQAGKDLLGWFSPIVLEASRGNYSSSRTVV
ncbi:MAG: hypothetical protein Q4D55_08370 [Eubacteriales bacterium]|nr:hypothetical protein [Eubacteriales bacterium]